MTLDLERLRADTPGVKTGIHFNNAGAALMPRPVLEAVKKHLDLEAERGGYEAAELRFAELEGVYTSVARMLGTRPGEVALTDNATRSWNQIFYAFPFRRGDRVLTCTSEYASNAIAFFQQQQRLGIEIVKVPDDGFGQIDLEALEQELQQGAALNCLCHIPTNGGLVQPAEEVGRLCRQYEVPYLLDACQSAGQVPISVDKIGCDFLSGTSRKYLRGPRGIGFLYVSADWHQRLEPPSLDLHSATWDRSDGYRIRDDARRFELWEADYAARLGFGAALDYYLNLNTEACWLRLQDLAARLREELKSVRGVQVHDLGLLRGGIVTLTAAGWTASELQKRLAAENIRVSFCTIRSARWDMERRDLVELLRASVHYYNTEAEVDEFVRAVRTLV